MSAIDFSKWNTLPWWKRNGYKTQKEAWNDFHKHQMKFAPEAFKNAAAVQEDVRLINSKTKQNLCM